MDTTNGGTVVNLEQCQGFMWEGGGTCDSPTPKTIMLQFVSLVKTHTFVCVVMITHEPPPSFLGYKPFKNTEC